MISRKIAPLLLILCASIASAGTARSLNGRFKIGLEVDGPANIVVRATAGSLALPFRATGATVTIRGEPFPVQKFIDALPPDGVVSVFTDRWRHVWGARTKFKTQSGREVWDYYLFDLDGRRTFSLKGIGFEMAFHPSPSGDYAIGWGSYPSEPRTPTFYFSNGRELKVPLGVQTGHWPPGYQSHILRFADDGNRLGMVAGKGQDQKSIFYSREGVELWRADWGGEITFSRKNGLAAIFSGAGAAIYDLKGKRLSSPKIPDMTRASHAEFSDDESTFALVTGDGQLGAFVPQTGRLLWTTSIGDAIARIRSADGPEMAINGLSISETGKLIAVGGFNYGFRRNKYGMKDATPLNSFVAIFSGAGKFIDTIVLPPNEPSLDDRNRWNFYLSEGPVTAILPTSNAVYSIHVQP